jgi:hypothetical protein
LGSTRAAIPPIGKNHDPRNPRTVDLLVIAATNLAANSDASCWIDATFALLADPFHGLLQLLQIGGRDDQ